MATVVPSRFAVLSIDDDDCKPKRGQKNITTNKTSQKPKNDKSKQQQQQQPLKKDDKKKQNKGKKKKTNNNHETQQWEQWKQKDTMAVEETFERELHQAILLSKLAYEEQLVRTATPEKDQESSKKSGKKVKKLTMSLEEFNNMGSSGTQEIVPQENEETRLKHEDAEFFNRVEKETKEEITKGKEKDILKARLNKIDEDIKAAQLKIEVEKRDEIITHLSTRVEKLNEELSQVKQRNEKINQILSCEAIKDIASVFAQVEHLQQIQDEFTSEIASLHAQLEQERSKTRTKAVRRPR